MEKEKMESKENESIATSYCINIPKDATNGDVFRTIFSNVVIGYPSDCKAILLEVKRDGRTAFGGIDTDWWNAPYKAESEDKE